MTLFMSAYNYCMCTSQANPHSIKDVDITVLTIVDGADKTKSGKLSEIVDSSQLRALRLPDNMPVSKVRSILPCLAYSHKDCITIRYIFDTALP